MFFESIFRIYPVWCLAQSYDLSQKSGKQLKVNRETYRSNNQYKNKTNHLITLVRLKVSTNMKVWFAYFVFGGEETNSVE